MCLMSRWASNVFACGASCQSLETARPDLRDLCCEMQGPSHVLLLPADGRPDHVQQPGRAASPHGGGPAHGAQKQCLLKALWALGSRAIVATLRFPVVAAVLPAGRQQALRGRTPTGQPDQCSDSPGAGGAGPGTTHSHRWLRGLSRTPGDYLRRHARRMTHLSFRVKMHELKKATLSCENL